MKIKNIHKRINKIFNKTIKFITKNKFQILKLI